MISMKPWQERETFHSPNGGLSRAAKFMPRAISGFVVSAWCLLVSAQAASQTANLWVDTDGGTCSRSSSPVAYSSSAACGSFAAATSAAESGDTIGVKAGTYPAQGAIGHATKAVTFIGEDGAVVDSGSKSGAYNHFYFSGNVTVENVDAAGDYPLVQFGGANNTWRDSTLKSGRQIRRCDSDEPILIQGGSSNPADAISGVTLQRVVIEQQRASLAGQGGCPSNDPMHLEMIRIGQNVNGVLIDQVTFGSCPNGSGFAGCGSGQLFITTTAGGVPPRNITVRNSKFLGAVNYHVQTHANIGTADVDWLFAYNTFGVHEPILFSAGHRDVSLIGNLGPRPQTCASGVTYVRNVWQWASGTACGSDKLVIGNSYSVDRLGIDSALRLKVGSPAIDAGESACSTTAAGADHDGNRRPVGSACDAGANEFGAGPSAVAPSAPGNLQIS